MQGRQFQGSLCPETVSSTDCGALHHVSAVPQQRDTAGRNRRGQQTFFTHRHALTNRASARPERLGHPGDQSTVGAKPCGAQRGLLSPTRQSGPRSAWSKPRPRVKFADARQVRARVEAHAEPMRLTGARRHVLTAVLALLCGWSRVTDDTVRLAQIVEAAAGACGRRYDLKTVGRALAALAAAGVITYVPACGRGRHAQIGIDPRFLGDIVPLERDSQGRVIAESVTFSAGDSSYKPNSYLPTLRSSSGRLAARRPRAVDVRPHDVRMVLSQLPAVFASLSGRLRWCLGREIRNRLAAGFEPEQILAVLDAPLPDHVERPWRLALWRLTHNMPGAGPRLAPLQRAWDRREAARAAQAHAAETTRWRDAVVTAAGEKNLDRVLAAVRARLGTTTPDESRALAHAGRMAMREYPGQELSAALEQWVQALAPEAPSAPDPDLAAESLVFAGGQGMCVACEAAAGVERDALPLRSVVCDACWTVLAPPELVSPELGVCA